MSRSFNSSRKVVPYGVCLNPKEAKRFRQFADQMICKQLSFAVGGIGCGIWDASIILSRFILQYPSVFKGRTVHEVGAGVGLPILYASFYAKRAILSDYLTSLVDNFNYNVKCNINSIASSSLEVEQPDYSILPKNFDHLPLWDIVYKNQIQYQKKAEDEEEEIFSDQPEVDYPIIDLSEWLDENLESGNLVANNNSYDERIGYAPPVNYPTWTLSDHPVSDFQTHRQNCYNNMFASAQSILLDWMNWDQLPQLLRDDLKCDIILGSEVSYPTILETLPFLVKIITQTLSDNGVFYLVQSPNRGTSLYFIEELCHKHDFLLDMRVVDRETELCDFESGQKPEDYVYYTFRRKNSIFPIMGQHRDVVAPPEGLSAEALVNINTNRIKSTPSGNETCEEIIFEMKLAVHPSI